jgi:hypothetical protein
MELYHDAGDGGCEQAERTAERAPIAASRLDALLPWMSQRTTTGMELAESGRMRKRIGLDHLDFHYLRKFMETYGQEMGYSVTQVAMRAGHDPSIAAKHYSGRGPCITSGQSMSPTCPRPVGWTASSSWRSFRLV